MGSFAGKYDRPSSVSQDQNISSMGVEPMVDSLPPILKLMTINCSKGLFEYLSLRDIKALRQTCKRMKQSVNYYIKLNYPRAFQNIRVDRIRLEYFHHAQTTGFEFISHMKLSCGPLNQCQIQGIQQILSQVESIEIDYESSDGDFYEVLLSNCLRLKHLILSSQSIPTFNGNRKKWLHRHYSTLEHIEFKDTNLNRGKVKCSELKTFFKRNPNVRFLSTVFNVIWQNRDWILKSHIKFERLDVYYYYGAHVDFNHVCDLLNKLHERGFYRRLHIWIDECEQDDFHRITSLRSLERLALLNFEIHWSIIPPLTSALRELTFRLCRDVEDSETISNNLTNVQRIDIEYASVNMILPFIRRCSKLKQIKIQHLLWNGPSSRTCIIDLRALNDQRSKLANSQKIAIFVHEFVYLRNKWKQNIDLSLIELKRHLSWEENILYLETI